MLKLRILVACEFSQIVTKAFREKGHEAFSCDLLPTEGNPDWHYQCDVLDILDENWDMMIVHDPCTFQCNSGVRHLFNEDKTWNLKRYELLKESCEFTKKLLDANIPKICRENPIPHKYAVQLIGGKYDQLVQPYQFGHPERKATCLWLKNLEPLQETNNVYEEMLKLPKNKSQRIHHLPPSKDRGKLRSITYQGIASAMANQWS